MPDLENQEFKFPDEVENETPKTEEKQEQEPDFEIEIENDVPKLDRRKNMPEEKVQDLEKDDLSKYDEEVQGRLRDLKKVWHDERRAKEQAIREQNEAIEVTKRLHEENRRMRELISSGEKEYVSAVKTTAELELEKAKKEYREAYESGDTDRIIDAQEKITQGTLKLDRINNFKPPSLQKEETVVQQQYQAPAKPDDRLVRWQDRNPWFGQDEEMTASALGLHEKLKRNGVVVGSDEYYKTLDQTIRKRFPEYFEEDQEAVVKEEPPKKSSTVVAPATRSTSAKKVKLTTTQVALAKKLGLTPEQYVKEVIKLEN